MPSSKICRLFLEIFCQHRSFNFVDQCVSQMFMIFFYKISKLVYIFISISLKSEQSNGIVSFTMLAPHELYSQEEI